MIRVSGAVRRRIGAQTAAAIEADPPAVAECRVCRRACHPATETVSLSVLIRPRANTAVWSHRDCAGSRVLTAATLLRDVEASETLMTEAEWKAADQPRRSYLESPLGVTVMETPEPPAPTLTWRLATEADITECSAIPDFIPAHGGRVICDFCELDKATCFYTVAPFILELSMLGMPLDMSSGRYFNACPTCADLVDADDQAAIIDRHRYSQRSDTVRTMVEAFFACRTGTGRTALTPEDGDLHP